MAKKKCATCGGSGKVMGGGMVQGECDTCDGSGKIVIVDDIDYLAKDTKHYQKAKNDIKKLDKNITDQEAEKILDEKIVEISDKKGKK